MNAVSRIPGGMFEAIEGRALASPPALVRLLTPPLLVLSVGCASMLHGTRQAVEIFTDPPGATATSGDQQVTTPGILRLARKAKNAQIRIEKDGFAPKTVFLERRVSGLVWLNLIGAPAGVVVGYSTSNHDAIAGGLSESITGGAAGAAGTAIGFSIDYGSGAAYRLDPARVVVRLEPASSSASGERSRPDGGIVTPPASIMKGDHHEP